MDITFDPTNYEFRNHDKATGYAEIEGDKVWYNAIDITGSEYQTEEIPVYFRPRINPFYISFEAEYELAKSTGDKKFGSVCEHDKKYSGRCVNCLRKVH